MATTFLAKLGVAVNAKYWNALDLSTVKDEVNQEYTQSFSDGEAASKAEAMWHDTRTIAASGTEDLDLAGVLVSGLLGTAITFKSIKAILIRAASTNTNNVVISRPAANGFLLFGAASDALAGLTPGGMFLFTDPSAAGVAVTAGTGDLLTITNSAGTTGVTYDVLIIGTV